MLRNIVFGLLVFWVYRRIGILLFKIRHASVDQRGTGSVSFTRPPDLLRFLLYKIVFRGRLRWFWPGQQSYAFAFAPDFRKYLWREYREIYGWPWLMLKGVYKEYRSRIVDQIYIKLRIRGKRDLKKSRFQELALLVEKNLKGFKIIELRALGGENQVFLRLPRRTMEFLGPWARDAKNPHNWFLVSKFQSAVCERLNAKLRLPSFSQKEEEKTKEVIVIVYYGTFCGNPWWGDFKPEKWEVWKKSFIDFFQQVALENAA
ncbi:hypothetical protein KKF25_01225 [Patescibacteria group bacterium]|nr:hypothetical protein [Patescibacteria group bacterium]